MVNDLTAQYYYLKHPVKRNIEQLVFSLSWQSFFTGET
jgi:hypothetical protein